MDMVTDDEVVESIKLLAQTEGIFAETAGGVTIGVLQKLGEKRHDQEGRRHRGLCDGQRLEDPRSRRRRGGQTVPDSAQPRRVRENI